MECFHGEPASSSKTTNGVFFYCGQARVSLVVIFSVHRMTVVTFIMLLLCGEIQTLLSQRAQEAN